MIVHVPDRSRLRAGDHPRAALFLDRDGVLMEDVHFARSAADVRVLPRTREALDAVRADFALVVVTNQSGLARGFFDEEALAAMHARLDEACALDAFYACPHHPEGAVARWASTCACRKPEPGLLLAAAEAHDLALDRSVMIGDAPRDVEAGRRAGVRSLLLENGHSLFEALEWIR